VQASTWRSKKAATFDLLLPVSVFSDPLFTTGAGGPSPSARKPRCRKVPTSQSGKDALRRLCYGPPGGDQRARNSSVAITGKARTNISWQAGRNCQTLMHEPRRIRRQKPRAELPNPAPALRIKLGDKSSSNRRLMGGLL